jgi:hypothetical protein
MDSHHVLVHLLILPVSLHLFSRNIYFGVIQNISQFFLQLTSVVVSVFLCCFAQLLKSTQVRQFSGAAAVFLGSIKGISFHIH